MKQKLKTRHLKTTWFIHQKKKNSCKNALRGLKKATTEDVFPKAAYEDKSTHEHATLHWKAKLIE